MNLAPVGVPAVWKGEDAVLPIAIESEAGADVTGLAHGDVIVKYARQSDATLQTFAPTSGQWTEKGLGLYSVRFPDSIINAEGSFMYVAQTTATGNKTYRGFTAIERRVEDRVWNTEATGYGVETMGGRGKFEVFAVPCYSEVDQKLTILIWLHKDGELVKTPTSCHVTIKEDGSTQVVDASSVLPTADGYFLITQDPYTLAADKNHAVIARVTYQGVEYTSGECGVSFN